MNGVDGLKAVHAIFCEMGEVKRKKGEARKKNRMKTFSSLLLTNSSLLLIPHFSLSDACGQMNDSLARENQCSGFLDHTEKMVLAL